MEYIEIKEQIKQKLPVARDLGDSENLLELGLSSLTIMRLVNQWRKQGVKVSFGSLMENPTLEGWWALIQRSIKKKAGKKRAQESKITPEKDMKQPFPLTDVQYRNAKHLEELLADNLNATYLLFTEGKMDVAEDFYTNTLIARYLNHIISDKIFHFYNPGMTILEIGAGTGASTELILKKVGVDVKYIFTDLSSYFLNAAQDKFSVFPNVEYQILDIDQDFSGQGIDQDSVDIVVASGMLNNALDTEFTISNIWKVLKKGGIIFIAEPVEELLELQISQVFMMTKPVDMRYLNNQTFFNEKQWIDILEKSNFEIVDIVPDDSDMLSVLQQKLIIGRK